MRLALGTNYLSAKISPIPRCLKMLRHPNVPDETADLRSVRLFAIQVLSGYQQLLEHTKQYRREQMLGTCLPDFERDRQGQLAEFAQRILKEFRVKRILMAESRDWLPLIGLWYWLAKTWTAWVLLALSSGLLPAGWRGRPEAYCLDWTLRQLAHD
jgi:hypothetical protein